jgi:UDP-GlcNAc:undecaprenyl-phosphate/decaprenyl-phosphate GlcNAc-1-phosphate transferase
VKAVVARHIFSFIFPFLVALYLFPLIIQAALKLDILDRPDGKIKKHEKAVPYLGGLAIYIPFIATLCIAYPFENHILWLVLGVTLLLFVGLIDDLKILKPAQKLFGQFIAVLCFLKGGFSLKTNFFSQFFNIITSTFWMLLVINAFNLVDVMDGLAASLALIAGFSFFIICLLLGQYAISILLLALLGPLLVFFLYNKPPAKIYLGDAGSLFVGGFLSAIPLLIPWSSLSFEAYYAGVIILGVPLLEVLSLIVIRTSIGIPFYRGSPHHFAIYLRKRGWTTVKILIFSGIMSLFLSCVSILFLFNYITLTQTTICGVLFLCVWFYFVFLPHQTS